MSRAKRIESLLLTPNDAELEYLVTPILGKTWLERLLTAAVKARVKSVLLFLPVKEEKVHQLARNLAIQLPLRLEIINTQKQFSIWTQVRQTRARQGERSVWISSSLLEPEFVIEQLASFQAEVVLGVCPKLSSKLGAAHIKGKFVDKVKVTAEGKECLPLTGSYLLTLTFWENCPDVIENEKQWLALLSEQARIGVVKTCVFEQAPDDGRLLLERDDWHYLAAQYFWKQEHAGSGIQVSDQAEVAPTARLLGDVYLEKGVRVGEFCVLRGPVYLGSEVQIADFTRIEASFIEEKSELGIRVDVAGKWLPAESKVSCRRAVKIEKR
ncbi:hypothetical protein IJJ27_03250 [bacterium]|nr:hypothetical protein [bacterium]MBQ6436550.1 hypothetical protein [bacterium]